MKNILKVAVVMLLISCAAFGSKILYKSGLSMNFENIGILELYYSEQLNSIYKNTDSLFYTAVNEEYISNINSPLTVISERINSDSPKKDDIINICQKYQLNGILIPKLKFIGVTQTMYFIPIGKYKDTEVELKLFNNTGDLVIVSRHNTTKGNSYMSNPSTDKTIRDGAKGAIKKILKEYSLLKK